MSHRLTGRNIVISGSATGVGRASSEMFAAEGAHVTIIDINEGAARTSMERITVNGGKAFLVAADVLKSAQVRRVAIVNTSSIPAVVGTEKEVLYCTSKGACHTFPRAITIENRAAGIRCNAVCPGFMRTPHGLRELTELRALMVDVSEADISRLQGRVCEPQEVASLVLFLMIDDASFVNGETLFVDNAMLVGT